MDPLAADFADMSPYNYVLGNPIAFIDPSGMAPEGWSKENADLADRFGLFGNGSDTYTSNFGEYQEEPIEIKSGTIVSVQHEGSAMRKHTSTVQVNSTAMGAFVDQINSTPFPKNTSTSYTAASLTLEIEIPYINYKEFFRRTSARKHIEKTKGKLQGRPELVAALGQYYDGLISGGGFGEIPNLKLDGLSDGYNRIVEDVLLHAGISLDVQIDNVRISASNSLCNGSPQQKNCHPNNFDQPVQPTKFNFIFSARTEIIRP